MLIYATKNEWNLTVFPVTERAVYSSTEEEISVF